MSMGPTEILPESLPNGHYIIACSPSYNFARVWWVLRYHMTKYTLAKTGKCLRIHPEWYSPILNLTTIMKKSSFKIEFRIRKRFSVTAEEGISLFVHKSVKENAETISLPLLKYFFIYNNKHNSLNI